GAERQRPEPADEAEQGIKENPVDDMGEGIPIAEMLRVAGAVDGAFPQLDVAAFADRRMPLDEEGDGLERHDRGDEQGISPPAIATDALGHPRARLSRGPGRSRRRQAPSM